VMRGY